MEEILAALQAILDEANGRELTDEEVARFEELEGKLTAVQRSEDMRARLKSYQEPIRNDVGVHVGTAKSDDTLERAFNHYLRTGVENQDLAELRAQSVGTDSAGGFTVPETFRNKITERLLAFGGLAPEVETITTSSGETLRWPTLDDTANSGVIATENTAPASGGADLVFGEVTLGAHKYVAPGAGNLPLRVSVELLQDSAFDIQGLISRKLGERIARAQAVDWVTGTGTGEPEGIIQSTGASQTFAGAAPTKDELIDALHTVDPDYRSGAVWVFNDTTLSLIRKMEDTTGRPLWQSQADAGLQDAPGGVLLGHRVVIDQAFADYTDASSNTWGVFGHVREGYIIRRVRDVTLIVNPYSRANEGQVEYTVWARADGAVQNVNAYSLLVNDAV
ncbi:HK97 family phage major capsid protein [Prauserella shujinwangii]|uniref:HK97 family phage major capsid protein n=1 Tax=Prauserella shujinwangii TaxID=1453103 RepID=A0A2T0LSW0_9PSEU|nr:HK97 family phage major capsid protein [Prauserella shujinwangii]